MTKAKTTTPQNEPNKAAATTEKKQPEQESPKLENKNQTTRAEAKSESKPSSTSPASNNPTSTAANEKPIETKAAAPTTEKKGAGNLLSLVALVIAGGAIAAGYNAHQQINHQKTELQSLISSTEDAVASFETSTQSSLSLAKSVKTDATALQGRVNSLEGKVNTNLSQVKQALDSDLSQLNNDLAQLKQSDIALNDALANLNKSLKEKRNDDWLAAEARHLIKIATHQAQLNNNAKAAVAALEAADQRLSDSSDPSLLQVRKALTDNIIALRGVSELDITGIALTLNQLENGVSQLAFADRVEQTTQVKEAVAETSDGAPEEASRAEQFASRIWADIKGLVSIRHQDRQQSTAMLPPGQQFFLQQNLRLKLETARLALLQRDTQTFQDTLGTAKKWIKTYFDTETTAVANMINSLAPYEKLDLQPTLPDISNSLRTLDAWQQQRNASSSIVENVEVSSS
ncbi:uroporphyrinogen-III C-methyltransferase [Pseudomonadota bacterium]